MMRLKLNWKENKNATVNIAEKATEDSKCMSKECKESDKCETKKGKVIKLHGLNKTMLVYSAIVLAGTVFTTPVFASGGDPLQVVNNLSDFIFSLIRALGIILLGFGILQVGLSLKSHDPSQRANGFLTLAGGIIITFTKEILTLITG